MYHMMLSPTLLSIPNIDSTPVLLSLSAIEFMKLFRSIRFPCHMYLHTHPLITNPGASLPLLSTLVSHHSLKIPPLVQYLKNTFQIYFLNSQTQTGITSILTGQGQGSIPQLRLLE